MYDLVPPQKAHFKLKYVIDMHFDEGKRWATIKKNRIIIGINLNHILLIRILNTI